MAKKIRNTKRKLRNTKKIRNTKRKLQTKRYKGGDIDYKDILTNSLKSLDEAIGPLVKLEKKILARAIRIIIDDIKKNIDTYTTEQLKEQINIVVVKLKEASNSLGDMFSAYKNNLSAAAIDIEEKLKSGNISNQSLTSNSSPSNSSPSNRTV
jgi:hypothetical protein